MGDATHSSDVRSALVVFIEILFTEQIIRHNIFSLRFGLTNKRRHFRDKSLAEIVAVVLQNKCFSQYSYVTLTICIMAMNASLR